LGRGCDANALRLRCARRHSAPGCNTGFRDHHHRRRWVQASSSGGFSLSLTGADDALEVTANSTFWNCCRLGYDGVDNNSLQQTLGDVDLTEGGQNDRFLLTFSDVPENFTVHISFFQGGINYGLPSNHLVLAGASNTEILFTQFSVLPTEVDNLVFGFHHAGTASTVSMTQIAAVPEPSTGLMLALGLGGLAWRSRMKH
jgi:hypothetical protein